MRNRRIQGALCRIVRGLRTGSLARFRICIILFFFLSAASALAGAQIRWTRVDGAVSYRVEIIDAAGKSVFERETSDLEVTIHLAPGNYRLRVSAVNKFQRVDTLGFWEPLVIQKRPSEFKNFAPARVSAASGGKLDLHGQNLPAGTTVSLENAAGVRTPLAAEHKNDAHMTAALPAGALPRGEYTVVLTTPDGEQYRRDGLTLASSGRDFEFRRFAPLHFVAARGGEVRLYGRNLPEGSAVSLEDANGKRIPLVSHRRDHEYMTALLPSRTLSVGEYAVVVTAPNGDQQRREGLVLDAIPKTYRAEDPFYFGAGIRYMRLQEMDYFAYNYTRDSGPQNGIVSGPSGVFVSDFFIGAQQSGFSAELGFSLFEPLSITGIDFPGAGERDMHNVLTCFDFTLAWSPNFNSPVNPVLGGSVGFMNISRSESILSSSGAFDIYSNAWSKRRLQAAVSFLLRFDVARDLWLDLGYRLQYLTKETYENNKYIGSADFIGLLARMVMTFGGSSSEDLDYMHRPISGHEAFGDIGIGLAASLPKVRSRSKSLDQWWQDGSGGIPPFDIFFSLWLREGMQMELCFGTGKIDFALDAVGPTADGDATSFKYMSFAMDVVFMPEYTFFIKPVLSLGIGLMSSSFSIVYQNREMATPTSLNLEARGAGMIRFAIGNFWLDAGMRARLVDSIGSEILFIEPLVRAGMRF